MSKYTKDYLLQQLTNHYEEFNETPVSTKFHIHQNNYRKYFGNWNNALREANIPVFNKTNKITTKCNECGNSFIQTPSQNKQFCDNSCSTSYSNKHRVFTDETKAKMRRAKQKAVKRNYPPHSNIRYLICTECNASFYTRPNSKGHSYFRKTCSKECESKIYSDTAKKNKLGGNWNRNSTWYDSHIAGRVHLESSWELKLAKDLDANNIQWNRPKHSFKWISKKQTSHKYYPDFYLPEYDCYLDPKNSFLQRQDEFKINYVVKEHNIKLLILSEHQLSWNAVKDLIGASGEI